MLNLLSASAPAYSEANKRFASRIACGSDMFLQVGGYWEDMKPLGYEDACESESERV